ncbi:MAG: hypothetical protein JKY42_00205 [Flavobacteriales bacterium]|nr:hypothetical protein [Flavobacteriales bacterium]
MGKPKSSQPISSQLWYAKDTDEVFIKLETNPQGLNHDSIIEQQQKYGFNRLPEPKLQVLLCVSYTNFIMFLSMS